MRIKETGWQMGPQPQDLKDETSLRAGSFEEETGIPAIPPPEGTAERNVDEVPNAKAYSGLLPILFANRKHELRRTLRDIPAFLEEDLNVKRLNEIHGWLGTVGKPQAARPIHCQLMMNRTILLIEQTDLRLTWNDSYIYIKPFPKYLLCREFWDGYISGDDALHANACGFILSYAWLICYQSNFFLATEGEQAPRLLPKDLDWSQWHAFLDQFLERVNLERPDDPECLPIVNKRYKYGELRLERLNKIYRFAPLWWFRHIFRGYYYGYH